jgi:hypothetical protein
MHVLKRASHPGQTHCRLDPMTDEPRTSDGAYHYSAGFDPYTVLNPTPEPLNPSISLSPHTCIEGPTKTDEMAEKTCLHTFTAIMWTYPRALAARRQRNLHTGTHRLIEAFVIYNWQDHWPDLQAVVIDFVMSCSHNVHTPHRHPARATHQGRDKRWPK